MKNFPLVSVIVPVFNAEQYLRACLDSIVNQTYPNLEIIVVDDGSLDGCPKICDDFASLDRRITVVHQANLGLSAARNRGMSEARGEFIVHVDGDDAMPLNAVSLLIAVQGSSQADIVFGDYIARYSDREEYVCRKFDIDKNQLIGNIVDDLCFPHFVWGLLIRRSLYTLHGIGPRNGINVGEDLQTLPQLLYYAGSIVKCEKAVYSYNCANTGSLTASYNLNRIRQDIGSIEVVRDFFREKDIGFYRRITRTEVSFINGQMQSCLSRFSLCSAYGYLSKIIRTIDRSEWNVVRNRRDRIYFYLRFSIIAFVYTKLKRCGGYIGRALVPKLRLRHNRKV